MRQETRAPREHSLRNVLLQPPNNLEIQWANVAQISRYPITHLHTSLCQFIPISTKSILRRRSKISYAKSTSIQIASARAGNSWTNSPSSEQKFAPVRHRTDSHHELKFYSAFATEGVCPAAHAHVC